MDTSVILPVEAEGFIQSLHMFSLKEVGSTRWFKQHEYIEKLNMQAILNASAAHNEFVKELLVSHGKDSCDSADDSVLDLVDYCHRKLTLLVSKRTREGTTAPEPVCLTASSLEALQMQTAAQEFDISLKALSVLRYITDHTDSISVISRILCTHNLPCVLVQLIETCPWSRCSKGDVEKYTNGRWQKIPTEDHLKITKLEGQVWISLYNLLLKEDCQRKYDFNNFNKNQLLKLRSFLTEVLIDQLPILEELRRFLAHLAITDTAPPKKELVLEQLPEIRNHIMSQNSGKWKAIAKFQVKEMFSLSEDDLRLQAQRLAQTYSLDVMENLIPEKPKCGSCGKEASKRCSQCQLQWYCHRECQVNDWLRHKKICHVYEATEKIQRELNISS
ncbi:zinc finger MYND domain-containing protein 10 isoform X2 [Thalassophryne amazonica]|uniref:zinc finger MYND domain-containing protein 10 isoform X2 n=1 Tax=Thalassophryne amazonica TaxID=390379 RepID=UPI00147260C1|nr:zinc finger MYND domain-containing protein 10 isoform X2 [Thalassophryne amazonica]